MTTTDAGPVPVSRVLLVHRYFWPDTPPYAAMLRSIAGWLASDGFRVTMLTSQPSYDGSVPRQPWCEAMDGAEVVRVPLLPESKRNWVARILNLALFSLRVGWHVLRRRYDVVMAATTPPVLVAWCASAAARLRGSRFVYHCQDIHPEIAAGAGILSSRVALSALRSVDRQTCQRASAIVVLSRDMAETIRASRGVDDERIRVINNFEIASFRPLALLPPELAKPPGRFRVLFAGNMGHFQALDTVIEAAHRLKAHSDIEFMLMGRGAKEGSLRAQAGDLLGDSVRFVGHQPQDVAEQALANADLGLITISPGICRVAYPSKTMTYLKAGCPVLVVVEQDSELAAMVRERGLGVTCAPGDADGLAEAILTASRQGPVTEASRAHIRSVGGELFSRENALKRWSALFGELGVQ